MWHCDCDKEGKHGQSVTLNRTSVDDQAICQRCKNYAVWVRPDQKIVDVGDVVNQKITVFKLTNDTVHFFDNLVDASIYAGYKNKTALASAFSNGKKYYYSSPFRMAYCIGHYSQIPYELKQMVEKHLIYCFKYDSGDIIAKGTYDELSKELEVPKQSIIAAYHRGYVNKKLNVVFSSNKNFNLTAFKTSRSGLNKLKIGTKDTPTFNDFLEYEDTELGVSYKKDTYGTWQDLLYH